jgi:uncharacterized protein (TIGR02246 family)
MKVIAGLVLLAAVASSCGQAGSVPLPDAVTTDFLMAFNARDADKVGAFYADDAQFVAPGTSPLSGRDAIAAALEVTFGQGSSLELERRESAASGDIAYEAGTFSLTMENLHDAATPELVAGQYVTVFRRVGNEWKIAHQVFTAGRVG